MSEPPQQQVQNEMVEELYLTMNLRQLLLHLDSTIGWSAIRSWFIEHGYLCKDPLIDSASVSGCVYKIKYMERTQLWRPLWAKQVRGTIVYKDRRTGRIQILKYLLPRGAEIVCSKQIPATIKREEQNLDPKRYALDEAQLQTARCLQNHNEVVPLNGYLSFKNDGSLCGITVFEFQSEPGSVYKELVGAGEDAFAIALLGHCMDSGYPYGLILNSQDTLFAHHSMLSYYISSCYMSSASATEEQIEMLKMLIAGNDVVSWRKIFALYLNEFILLVVEFATTTIQESLFCLSFEAICANRTCLMGELHTELAVTYPVYMFRFLGLSKNLWCNDTDVQFIPHCAIPQIPLLWDEPLWWHVQNNVQVRNMILHLEQCLVPNSGWTEASWLQQYPPANTRSIRHCHFDYEGFVYYSQTFVYSKIKTTMYYQAHHMRAENINTLLQCSDQAALYFPLIRDVKQFFGRLHSSLLCIALELRKQVTDIIHCPEHPVVKQLNVKAQVALFKQTQFAVQCKMIFNGNSDEWTQFILIQFIKEFPQLQNKEFADTDTSNNDNNKEYEDNVKNTIKSVCMLLQPWLQLEQLTIFITTLVASTSIDKSLSHLFVLCHQ